MVRVTHLTSWVSHNPCRSLVTCLPCITVTHSTHEAPFGMSKDVQPPKKPAQKLLDHVTAPEGTSLFRTVNFERYAVLLYHNLLDCICCTRRSMSRCIQCTMNMREPTK